MTLNISDVMLAIASLSFYALAIILAALKWKLINAGKTANDVATLLPIWIALALHALLLHRLVWLNNEINLGFASSLTLSTWCITLVSVLIAWHRRIPFLVVIVSALSASSIIVALLLPSHINAGETYSISLTAHIVVSILSYSLLSIAAIFAVLLGIQDYQLHHHRQGLILKMLPPLQTMEDLMFRLIETGFALLSIGVPSGFLFTDKWFTHKIVFSCIAWLVFLTLLLGRYFAGWRGQNAIRWTLTGIGLLMLAFFGTKLVFEFILS